MILSFDVWNTLITPNPEFKEARIGTFMDLFGESKEKVEQTLNFTKSTLDFIQEEKGKAFDSLFCWKLFTKHMGLTGDLDKFAKMLLNESNELFYDYPPKFDVELVKEIRKAKKRAEVQEVMLVSNTNFVPGKILWSTCFEHLDLFDGAYFSDQHGFGKPAPEVFRHAWGIYAKRVFHIGDTQKTDGSCTKYGAQFIKVKNPDDTLKRLSLYNNDFGLKSEEE